MKAKTVTPKILVRKRQSRLVLRRRLVIGRTRRQHRYTTCPQSRCMLQNLGISWLPRKTNRNHECCLQSGFHLVRSCKKHSTTSHHRRLTLLIIYNHHIRRQMYRSISQCISNIIKSETNRASPEIITSRLIMHLHPHIHRHNTLFPSQVQLLGTMDGLHSQQRTLPMRNNNPTSGGSLR